MATRRRFSKAFKRQVVEEFLAGGMIQAQLDSKAVIKLSYFRS